MGNHLIISHHLALYLILITRVLKLKSIKTYAFQFFIDAFDLATFSAKRTSTIHSLPRINVIRQAIVAHNAVTFAASDRIHRDEHAEWTLYLFSNFFMIRAFSQFHLINLELRIFLVKVLTKLLE